MTLTFKVRGQGNSQISHRQKSFYQVVTNKCDLDLRAQGLGNSVIGILELKVCMTHAIQHLADHDQALCLVLMSFFILNRCQRIQPAVQAKKKSLCLYIMYQVYLTL